MGWYHDANFNWDDLGDNAPACSINNKPSAGKTACSVESQATASPKEAPEEKKPNASGNTACSLPADSPPPPPPPDVEYIYHLCQDSNWKEALRTKQPYFPPTYMKDGKFTRATVYKSDLVSTANEFYKDTPGDWIVLEISCKMLFGLGIPIMAQEAPESTPKQPVKCLKVFGGITTTFPGLIVKTYKMKRSNDGTFLQIVEPTSVAKLPTEEEKKEESPMKTPAQAPEKSKRRFWPRLK